MMAVVVAMLLVSVAMRLMIDDLMTPFLMTHFMMTVGAVRHSVRSIPVTTIVDRHDPHRVRNGHEAHIHERTAPATCAIPVPVLDEVPVTAIPIEIVVVIADVIDVRLGHEH